MCGWIERIPGGTRQYDGLETGIIGARPRHERGLPNARPREPSSRVRNEINAALRCVFVAVAARYTSKARDAILKQDWDELADLMDSNFANRRRVSCRRCPPLHWMSILRSRAIPPRCSVLGSFLLTAAGCCYPAAALRRRCGWRGQPANGADIEGCGSRGTTPQSPPTYASARTHVAGHRRRALVATALARVLVGSPNKMESHFSDRPSSPAVAARSSACFGDRAAAMRSTNRL